jgi:hypothetical protein
MNTRKMLGASDETHAFVDSLRKAVKLRYSKPLVDYIFSKLRKDKAFLADIKATFKK